MQNSFYPLFLDYQIASNENYVCIFSGALDILLKNFSSEDDQIRFESARLLEQSLTTENRAYIVENGLQKTVQIACECTKSCSFERSRIGVGILEHLFKNSEEICHDVIRMGGLCSIIHGVRSTDTETLRHCAAALANLSLHGGHENQVAMIQHKVRQIFNLFVNIFTCKIQKMYIFTFLSIHTVPMHFFINM